MTNTLTPWAVSGTVDYMAQITKFGTMPIDGKLLKRWEEVTGVKPHTWLRRGVVFSHQDVNRVLDCVEKGIPIFIYTGRGPSSDSMHLGHMVPFKFTKYLQDALNCIVIIQMSDDEKFIFKEGSKAKDLKNYNRLCYENAKDIIACGFDVKKTFIFSNLECNNNDLYFNNILIAKATSMNSIKGTYGIGETVEEPIIDLVKKALETEKDPEVIRCYEKLIKNNKESNNIGQCIWPVFQCGPAFATSFRQIFIKTIEHAIANGNDNINLKKVLRELSTVGSTQSMMCLVPMAIDQAPYFRMARDVAGILDHPKPAVIHSEFLPGLMQTNGKMNSSVNKNATLFLDMNSKQITNAIKKYAFSGGQESLDKHRELGGDIKVDICYQYLTYFLDDDIELKNIAEKYSCGEMTSGELKLLTANVIVNEIEGHQKNKLMITRDKLMEYFDVNRVLDIGGVNKGCIVDDDYDGYGINFDRTFGYKNKNLIID